MSNSIGEAAKEEANAQRGRSVDRDLEQLVFGYIRDRGRTTRSQRRIGRIDHFEHEPHAGDAHVEKDIHGNAMRTVEHVYFVGFMLTDDEYANLIDRLEALRGHVAQIIDMNEANVFDRLVAADINTAKLGDLGPQLSDCVLEKYSFQKLWDEA